MKLIDREPTPEMLRAMGAEVRGGSWSMTAIFNAAYDAAPEVKNEPVAEVVWFDPATLLFPEKPGKIIDGLMAFMDGATVGTKLFAYPPDAQVEIAKRDARITKLEKKAELPMKYKRMQFNAELQREVAEQAAEIARLKGVIAKCEESLEGTLGALMDENPLCWQKIIQEAEEALAAIKEEGL